MGDAEKNGWGGQGVGSGRESSMGRDGIVITHVAEGIRLVRCGRL